MSTLTVSLVQYDIQWLSPEHNFKKIERLTAQLEPCDLLLLPETFATGFALKEQTAEFADPALTFMRALAAQHNCVVAGSVLVSEGDKKANRFYWCWPPALNEETGRVEYYDKRHLFCLGHEGNYVSAGRDRKVFEIGDFKILPQVCYDLRFPVFQRNRNDYDVMVNVANWPAARRFAWDTLLRARAIENQCYVLANNRIGEDGYGTAHNGGTVALDYLGQSLLQVPDDQTGVITTTLSKEALVQFRTQFPAHLDADDFNLEC
ncbi:nitrilase-related carbon-nitrogen hydrolase [Pseudoalteromonas luteoviolacea]|uniref:nitrilase-related carbon-nitrogen hydrolase n=1 Tax=Pseudoalteromonas luteoviolacea TaxID=43657 RepID=UPI00115159D9|nr:nitrilase-related carbon-nitrogen hydrolase [Pseudoalteromonas luteoviolacea]TQF72470.1 nitrilase family protein [Pseudoalteromonas luteoviolacea]